MPSQVNMHEAKTHLSRLAERAANGEEIVIARDGKPLAKLVPVQEHHQPITFGLLKGKIEVPDDFDEPDEEVIALFEGEHEEKPD